MPAAVDEDAIKRAMAAESASVEDTAIALADLKAARISQKVPLSLVIGADQILECNGRWFDKPPDEMHLRAHLQALRGRDHRLVAGVCVARGGSVIWRHIASATLRMRDFSDTFLEGYVKNHGPEVLSSVGGYRLEETGIQLFSHIDGDYFTILGLPMLPLLDFLRTHEVVPT